MHKKIIILPFILALVLYINQTSIVSSATTHQQPGYTSVLESYLQTQMDTYRIPGMSLAIVRDGQVEIMAGLGSADSTGRPVTPDTPFLLASLSKSFTALGVMQLVEKGQLELDDPVQEHLPWFQVAGGQGGEITVAHLLYHTSGFTEQAGLQANLAPDSPNALEAGVRGLKQLELKFVPGAVYEYSNLNYAVLGLLIQEISGLPYEAYIQEHIFAPLEMQRSYTSMSGARAGGAASSYYPFFGFPLVTDRFMPYNRFTLPAGGLWSTASDMSRYLLAHLNGGSIDSKSLLSPSSVQSLHRPGIMFDDVQGYAMGWTSNQGFMPRDQLEEAGSSLKDRGELGVLFHEGDWLGYKSVAFLVPELEYGLVMLMNSNDPTVTSALRFMAWDVTVIATGGEPAYFPPAESFIQHHSRLLFVVTVLSLSVGLFWIVRILRHARDSACFLPDRRSRSLLIASLFLVLSALLLSYLMLVLLPGNNLTLVALLRFAPDLGLLLFLILLLAASLVTACLALILSLRLQGRISGPLP